MTRRQSPSRAITCDAGYYIETGNPEEGYPLFCEKEVNHDGPHFGTVEREWEESENTIGSTTYGR